MLFQSESRKTVYCQDLDKQEGFQGPWITLLLSPLSQKKKKGAGGTKNEWEKIAGTSKGEQAIIHGGMATPYPIFE